MKFLIADIYRFPLADCTNDGITSPNNAGTSAFIECEEGNYTLEQARKNGNPILRVVRRNIYGHDYVHVEPFDNEAKAPFAAGGNFVFTSDSRFRSINAYPVSVHDHRIN